MGLVLVARKSVVNESLPSLLCQHISRLVEEACTSAIQSRVKDNPSGIGDPLQDLHNANGTSSLLLQADDAKKLASTKSQICDLVGGELLLDPCCTKVQKVPFWEKIFASRENVKKLTDKINLRFGPEAVAVLFHWRRQEVHMYVKPLLQNAREFAVKLLLSLKPSATSVPIGPDQCTFLLARGRDPNTSCRSVPDCSSLLLSSSSFILLIVGLLFVGVKRLESGDQRVRNIA